MLGVVPLMLWACAGPLESSSSFNVGAAGGSFDVAGLVIDIPAGALDTDVTISIRVSSDRPDGYSVYGDVYRFAPDGLRFATPVTISFPTTTSDADAGVFWTLEGASDRFERLVTEFRANRAIAETRHFSRGFVGRADASPGDDAGIHIDGGADGGGLGGDASAVGVSCEVERRREPETGCMSTIVERDVRFWLVPSPDGDPEGALATSSEGIHALYNETDPNWPLFISVDGTNTLYRGYDGSPADFGTAHRSGDVISFTLDASRGGAPVVDCAEFPLIAVRCWGTTTLSAR